ncbi:unnamed protein product, partial [Mesorhabditis belari]|uniref:Transmembrane protein 106B n=1 Tax=Mesorhabditis belari TaxID=2138241 RepID=A0AAF3J3L5_9BILA
MSKLWTRIKGTFSSEDRVAHERLREERAESAYGAAASDSSNRLSNDYTELRSGNVLCPSCKGTGWIPRELEETLVALIPINDDRLKPKRTFLWVCLGVGVVLIIAFVLIFMLMPRAVNLSPNHSAIDIIKVYNTTESPPMVFFGFKNFVNISNHNYYAVRVVNTTSNVISRFQPWSSDQLGTGLNHSSISVGPLSTMGNQLFFWNNVTITDIAAEYCRAPFSRFTSTYVNMQFDVAVDLEYFNHKERVTLTTIQQVCCVPSGNCTSG